MAVAGINIRGIVSEIMEAYDDALLESNYSLPEIFAEFAEEAAESEQVYDDAFDPRRLQAGQQILDGPPAQLPLLLQTCLRLRRRLQEPDLQRAGHDVRLYRLRLALDGLYQQGVTAKPKLKSRQVVDLLIQVAGITDRGMWTALSETLDVVDIHLQQAGMNTELDSALKSLRSAMLSAQSTHERNLRRRIRDMLGKEWPITAMKTLRIVTPPKPSNVERPAPPGSRCVRQAEELLAALDSEQARRIVRSAFNAAIRTPLTLSTPRQAELLMDYVVMCGLPDAPPMLEWVADLAAVLSGSPSNPGIDGVIETCLYVLTSPIQDASASLERLATASRNEALSNRARLLLQAL